MTQEASLRRRLEDAGVKTEMILKMKCQSVESVDDNEAMALDDDDDIDAFSSVRRSLSTTSDFESSVCFIMRCFT